MSRKSAHSDRLREECLGLNNLMKRMTRSFELCFFNQLPVIGNGGGAAARNLIMRQHHGVHSANAPQIFASTVGFPAPKSAAFSPEHLCLGSCSVITSVTTSLASPGDHRCNEWQKVTAKVVELVHFSARLMWNSFGDS
uniref:Uncharacterized protein n=1 Tax=Physcomitrium patens TaxID=3218 RepID=A0A2K1JMK5_PHYPA|nr:hypothetical protein PHYPA_017610 [Physcomitrium patens]